MRSLAFVATWMLLAGAAAAQEPDSTGLTAEDAAAARGVVESLHATLLSCMQEADELGFEGRYDRIVATVDETFDLPLMARTALGTTWRELDGRQRGEFIDLSRRLSATRYADNFDGYDGQRFETRGVLPAARRTFVVLTELVQPNGESVRFDYRLRLVDGRWRIIDIMLDAALSELALRRSQYRAILDRGGFPHLVETMELKIDELSTE